MSVGELLHELRVSRTEREILDKELRDSAAINRAILDSIATEIAVLDHAGVIVALNQAWRFSAFGKGIDRDIAVHGIEIGDNLFAAFQHHVFFQRMSPLKSVTESAK